MSRTTAQQLLMPKEIADAFEARGVRISVRYARALVRACPASIRRRYCTAEAAWQWWVLNPDWTPRGKNPVPVNLPLQVATPELSAALPPR